MLGALFNDEVSVRRLTGARDGHGKPTLKVMTEEGTDVPFFVRCYVERRRTMARTAQGGTKVVDAQLVYNADDAPLRILEDDLLVVRTSGETFRVTSLDEQKAVTNGRTFVKLGLARTKAPVAGDAASPDEV